MPRYEPTTPDRLVDEVLALVPPEGVSLLAVDGAPAVEAHALRTVRTILSH